MASKHLPPLIEEREDKTAFLLMVVVPSVFGIFTGIMLGVSEPIYLVLSILGIAGGFGAGIEHDDKWVGVYRGLLGGLLFGFWILFTHGVLFDDEPKAHLPDPEVGLILITAGLGAILGTLGARWRAKQDRSAA
jgi:hypothetical protein